MRTNDYGQGTHNLTWQINDLPEGYDYAYEWRLYENGYLQSYDYLLTNLRTTCRSNLDLDRYRARGLRPEAGGLYYLSDESSNDMEHITGRLPLLLPELRRVPEIYPWTNPHRRRW